MNTFNTRNFEAIKEKLLSINHEGADYYVLVEGLNPFIYESPEFEKYFNNCGEANEPKFHYLKF